VPPSNWPAGAQGGTLSCRSGAALSFVSCIRLFGAVVDHRNSIVSKTRRASALTSAGVASVTFADTMAMTA
jgi:hypothetical protein